MDQNNPFDKALAARKPPEPYLSAAVDVTDTLDLAWCAARSVFAELARPEHAIELARLMLLAAGRIPADTRSHQLTMPSSDTE